LTSTLRDYDQVNLILEWLNLKNNVLTLTLSASNRSDILAKQLKSKQNLFINRIWLKSGMGTIFELFPFVKTTSVVKTRWQQSDKQTNKDIIMFFLLRHSSKKKKTLIHLSVFNIFAFGSENKIFFLVWQVFRVMHHFYVDAQSILYRPRVSNSKL